MSQSLWSRAGSFDLGQAVRSVATATSQSLWSRAGSFDATGVASSVDSACLNPFGAGQGLSTLS